MRPAGRRFPGTGLRELPISQLDIYLWLHWICVERLIQDAIMTHMTENDLLSPKQHGFIQGRFCVTQLLAVLDSWTLALDDGGTSTSSILTSQRRLTRTVPHQRLLTKLREYGIEGRILTWIEAFLTERRQRVVVNDSRSPWAEDRLRALKLPSLYYRRARGDMIEAYKFTHSIYKTEQEPLQRETNATTRYHSHKLQK